MTQTHYVYVGWLIDGLGSPIRKRVLLTISDGKISALQDCGRKSILPPEPVTDLSGCTILPPLIDSHVHLCMSGTVALNARKKQLQATYEDIRPLIRRHIINHFNHGVLAVRDGGDRFGHTLQFKIRDNRKGQMPVVLKAAGKAWHRQGRYGSMLGRYPENQLSLGTAYSSENDPVDHVKIINSGPNSLTQFARETLPQFDLEEMGQIVLLANRDGRKVMVHANGTMPVQSAIEGGCQSIEHGFFMGRDNLRRMADNQVAWVPTAVAMKALLENIVHLGDCVPAVIEKTLHHQLEQMSIAREYGVPTVLGTDSGSLGVSHGAAVAEEFNLFLQAGYSLPEAVQCGTGNGAALLNLKDSGHIAKSMPADFLVFRCSPDQLTKNFPFPDAIYLNGHPRQKCTVQ